MDGGLIAEGTGARSRAWIVARAVVTGVIVSLLVGSAPFGLLLQVNARHHPEIPWLALGELALVLPALAWLGGWGPPRATATARRHDLRLWRAGHGSLGERVAEGLPIVGLILAIDVVYIFASAAAAPPPHIDAAVYPTTAIRFSAWIMGAFLSGVGEEAGFRGYMQSRLERLGPTTAIAITSVAFALAHLTKGWAILPVLPGYFLISVLYSILAYRTGSVVPGMALHALGDLALAYFVLLGGNGALLFA
jgi:membrane protease YdiL (CAAX protease family)